MKAFNQVVYNVYSNHPTDGLILIGQGLPSEKAIELATKVFAESKWTIDTQVVPVPAAVYRASLQTCDSTKTGKKPTRHYSFSSS
jgi:hypothetical protein